MLAARRAVKIVQELGLHDSHFEGDSLVGIKALQRGNMLSSSFGYLIMIFYLLLDPYGVSLSHTLR